MQAMEDSTLWRQRSSAGLPYRTLKGASGSAAYNEGTVTEKYLIVATDLFAWLEAAFPVTTSVEGTLYNPQQPVIPGLGTLVPTNISFDSFDSSKPVDPFSADPDAPDGTYGKYMVLTVQYGTHPNNGGQSQSSEPFTFLQSSANASGVFLNSPIEKGARWELIAGISDPYDLAWNSNTFTFYQIGEPVNVENQNIPHGITEPQIEWTVTWPSIPFTYFRDTLMPRMRVRLGCVNSSPMSITYNAPADTILFMSFSASSSFTWQKGYYGMPPMSLSMKFIEKNFISTVKGIDDEPGSYKQIQVTHNHLYRPNYGYRRLKLNGNYLYNRADMNAIWS